MLADKGKQRSPGICKAQPAELTCTRRCRLAGSQARRLPGSQRCKLLASCGACCWAGSKGCPSAQDQMAAAALLGVSRSGAGMFSPHRARLGIDFTSIVGLHTGV